MIYKDKLFSGKTRTREIFVSGFKFQVSGFKFQVSGFKFQVSGFKFQVSSFRFQVSGFKFQVTSRTRLVFWGESVGMGKVRLDPRSGSMRWLLRRRG